MKIALSVIGTASAKYPFSFLLAERQMAPPLGKLVTGGTQSCRADFLSQLVRRAQPSSLCCLGDSKRASQGRAGRKQGCLGPGIWLSGAGSTLKVQGPEFDRQYCNPSTQEAEAGGSRVQGQPELHDETLSRGAHSWVSGAVSGGGG